MQSEAALLHVRLGTTENLDIQVHRSDIEDVRVMIVGCGYAGLALARRLLEPAIASSRRPRAKAVFPC